jgi:transcription antitermination protein NusB
LISSFPIRNSFSLKTAQMATSCALYALITIFRFPKLKTSGMVKVGMGKRREARERAVQFLFQHDMNPPEDLEAALNHFWDSQRAAAIAEDKGIANWGQPVELPPPSADEAAMRLFAEPLIRGTLEHRDESDALIKKHAQNWDLHRIAAVDRNILRLAIYEMLHRDDIPPVVSINEAVDIAKKFSTQDSGKFVNGILDKIKSELMRPAREVK